MFNLDVQRAKEIISSPETINVNYNGSSVWIDRVNEDGATATVHEIHERGTSGERKQVRITDLKEVHH